MWNVSTSHFDRAVWQSSRAVIDKISLTVWCQQRSPKECYWCCTLQLNRHLWTWCVITAASKEMGFCCGISWCHSGMLQDVNSIFYFISVWINPSANWCFFNGRAKVSLRPLWMKTSDCGVSKPANFGELIKKKRREKGLKKYFQPKNKNTQHILLLPLWIVIKC